MRFWAKKLMDEPPKDRSQMTPKDKVLTILSTIVDATIICLLVYTLIANSCQICYTTSSGANTFKQCRNVADVMETGLPSEVINIYEGKTQPNQLLNNGLEIENGKIGSAINITTGE